MSEEERDTCTQLEHDEIVPDRPKSWARRNCFGCMHFLFPERPVDDEFYKYIQHYCISAVSISSEHFVEHFVVRTHQVRPAPRCELSFVVELRPRIY